MFTLKVLGPAGRAAWRALRLAALAEAPYAFGSRLADRQGEGDREERWRARLSIAGSHNLIALRDREPVGMASGISTDVVGVAKLVSMWVAPSARGRGVGDLLLGAVRRRAYAEKTDLYTPPQPSRIHYGPPCRAAAPALNGRQTPRGVRAAGARPTGPGA